MNTIQKTQNESMRQGFKGIRVIAVVNTIAAALHVAFWALAFTKLPFPLSLSNIFERASVSMTYGFGMADLVWSLSFLILSAIGLWRGKAWGWLFAHMVNALYWYSMTVIVIRDLYTGTISPGTVIFFPFTLFAFWAAIYLWKVRRAFW